MYALQFVNKPILSSFACKGRPLYTHTHLNEVVLGLLFGELRDRGQDAVGVAGEENDIGRVSTDARELGVRNLLDRVRASGVLGKRSIVIVWDTGGLVVRNVLKDRAELDGIEDLGLLLSREADALGVATAFDIEDTVVGPNVLIVTDEASVGVSGQRRLARARETEEERDVAVLALVGRRVQRKLAELDGLQVVHDGEDALLHLTCVLGTEDDHLATLEVDLDGRCRSHASGEPVSRELTCVVDNEVGIAEALKLLTVGSDEHVVHEQGVVGSCADDANLDAVLRLPTGEAVKDVDVLAGVEVVDGTLSIDLEGVLVHLDIDGSPPDVVLGGVLEDDSLVLWRSTSLLTGEVDQCAVAGNDSSLLGDRILVQCSNRSVALEVTMFARSKIVAQGRCQNLRRPGEIVWATALTSCPCRSQHPRRGANSLG